MASQEFLGAALRARLDRAGVAPDAEIGPADPADAEDALVAVAVLRRFDPLPLAESVLRFSGELPADQAEPWLRAFTRTIFLAGNPANLRDRFAFTEVAGDGSIAWSGPAPAREFTGLRRLLKLFPAGRLAVADRVRLPGGAPAGPESRPRRLVVATAGLTVADYLVHLNHTLAEAVLTGLLRPGSGLLLEHVPDIDDAVLEQAETIRVHRDLTDPRRLRGYACLTPAGAEPEPA